MGKFQTTDEGLLFSAAGAQALKYVSGDETGHDEDTTDPRVLTFPTEARKEKTKRAFRIAQRDGGGESDQRNGLKRF